MTEKQRAIFDKITELRDRLEDFKCEMGLLRDACEKLSQERDAAIERTEKAEREVERLGEIVTECDGIECIKHDSLVRGATKRLKQAEERAEKAEASLKKIADADIEANRFPTWKDLASEVINIAREAIASPEEKETAHV